MAKGGRRWKVKLLVVVQWPGDDKRQHCVVKPVGLVCCEEREREWSRDVGWVLWAGAHQCVEELVRWAVTDGGGL